MLRRLLHKIVPPENSLPLAITGLMNLIAFSGPKLLQVLGWSLPMHDMTAAFDRAFPFSPVWVFVYVAAFPFWIYQYSVVAKESRSLRYRLVAADFAAKVICLLFFVLLPTQDLENNEWVYDVSANVKFGKTPVPDDGDTVTRKVLKVWDDDGAEDSRPQEITVELLRNGKVYDTVKLSEKNNWRYTWLDLDADARWSVTEKTVSGYTVSITREGITFVVTNTKKPDRTDTPDTPVKPSNPSKPSSPAKPTLPQTGAVWWHVEALALSGLVFLILGALDRKTEA